MNILIYTTSFYPAVGGLETHTLLLIEQFLKKGHNIKVINTQFQKVMTSGETPELEKVEIFVNPSFFKILRLFSWCTTLYMPNFSLKAGWFLLFYPFKHLIISHNDFYLFDKTSFKTRIKLVLIKFAFQNISVSNSVAGYIKTKSAVIHNCYDNDIFKIYPNESRKYDLVFLGRMVSQKGCDLLIKACKNIEEDFTLNMIGDGPERPELEKLVKDLGLQQKIKFLGVIQGEELARVLNRHRIMVIPSIGNEGFGIVAIEGMACGCRVIAANAGGLSEAVKSFGKIFKMGDQQDLEKKMNYMLKESKQEGFNEITEELHNFLIQQKKETVAEEYLSYFK